MTNIDIGNQVLFYRRLPGSLNIDQLTSGADPITVQHRYTAMPVNFITRPTTVCLTL